MKPSTWGCFVAAALIAACGDSPTPAKTDDVFEPLTETLERARAVEASVLEQAEEQRRRIEEAENGR